MNKGPLVAAVQDIGQIKENELERIWKEAVMACFKLLSWHMPGGTTENHETTSIRIDRLRAEI
jgi:hypothetical protein